MPNWCYNRLFIYGDHAERIRFVDACKVADGYRLVDGVMPMPEVLVGTQSPAPTSPTNENYLAWFQAGEIDATRFEQLREEHALLWYRGQQALKATGYTDWYEWCNDNWGTKWGDCRTEINQHDEDRTEFQYETAWGPFGLKFVTAMGSAFPQLTFVIESTEESHAFVCVSGIQGKTIVQHESEVADPPEEILNPPIAGDEPTAYEDDLKYDAIWNWVNDWQNDWVDQAHDAVLIELKETVSVG